MATPQRKPQPTPPAAKPAVPASTDVSAASATSITTKPSGAAPTAATTRAAAAKAAPVFLFDRSNYYWMLGGLALILLGFFLLAGGKSPDPTKFNYDEIYSFRRITLAPLLMLAGFGMEVYAIMKRPRGSVVDAAREHKVA